MNLKEENNLYSFLHKAQQSVGSKTGIIKNIFEVSGDENDLGLYNCQATICNVRALNRFPVEQFSAGLSWNKDEAIAAALGEGIERYSCGYYNTDKLLKAKYGDIKKLAVNLENFALYSDKQYNSGNFLLKKPNNNIKLNWVKGYSLLNNKNIYVPACFVYTPYKFGDDEDFIVWESNSTGTAVGNTKEDAILGGIYEVIERDAVMINWRNKLEVPNIDLYSIKNQLIKTVIDTMRKKDWELRICDITSDIGIPTFLSILTSKNDRIPKFIVGASCNITPQKAIIKSIKEVFQGQQALKYLTKKSKPINNEFEFDKINHLSQHTLLYGIYDLKKAYEFLFKNISLKSANHFSIDNNNTISEKINLCIDRIRQNKILNDIIAVDITPPDIRELNIHAFRIIIPGCVNLNASYKYRYLGGRRLYEVPKILGYTNTNTKEEELNTYPHPFP